MDIKPPRPRTPTPPAYETPIPQPQPIEDRPVEPPVKKKSSLKKILLWIGLGLLIVIIGVALAGWFWYQNQLSPLGSDSNEHIKVTIVEGSTPAQIAERIVAYKRAGVNLILGGFLHFQEEIEYFGQKVLPLVREIEAADQTAPDAPVLVSA